jgi:hypothetical protein
MKSGFRYAEVLDMEEAEFRAFLDILFPQTKSGVRAKTYTIPRPE